MKFFEVYVPKGALSVEQRSRPFRESADRDAVVASAAPGTAVDPICGMTVDLGDGAITFESDGRTYGFCGPGCLQVFKEDRRR